MLQPVCAPASPPARLPPSRPSRSAKPVPAAPGDPPLFPAAVTRPCPRPARQGGAFQPRARSGLKRSQAASCRSQVERAAGGSGRAPARDQGGRASRPAPRGPDHNAPAAEPPSPGPAARRHYRRGERAARREGGWVGDAKVPDVPARRGGGGERLPSARAAGAGRASGRGAGAAGSGPSTRAGKAGPGARRGAGTRSPPLASGAGGRAGRARAGERRLRWVGELWAPINGCHSSV